MERINIKDTTAQHHTYEFLTEEVLSNTDSIQHRKDNLYMALILGNNYNKVIRLTTHTTEGLKVLEGVMLALTEAFVIFKSGLKVPICCVEEVRIY
jgi:hypothetical protein